jgi:osmotically-inducible protein OsmY
MFAGPVLRSVITIHGLALDEVACSNHRFDRPLHPHTPSYKSIENYPGGETGLANPAYKHTMNHKTNQGGYMRKMILASLVVMAFSMVLTACAPTDTTETTRPKTKMTDSELENKIKANFDSDANLKAADLSVSANADKNEATISGTVSTQALRTKAVNLAKEASPGLILTDKIDVKPRELTRAEYTEDNARTEREKAKGTGEKVGDSLDDAWIHAKIVTKLIGDTNTPERKINVDVVNNVVTLHGMVDTAAQRAEAERVAKDTEGVKRVINQLKVG